MNQDISRESEGCVNDNIQVKRLREFCANNAINTRARGDAPVLARVASLKLFMNEPAHICIMRYGEHSKSTTPILVLRRGTEVQDQQSNWFIPQMYLHPFISTSVVAKIDCTSLGTMGEMRVLAKCQGITRPRNKHTLR